MTADPLDLDAVEAKHLTEWAMLRLEHQPDCETCALVAECRALRGEVERAGEAVQADARQTLEARAALAESQAEVKRLTAWHPQSAVGALRMIEAERTLAERDATIAAVRELCDGWDPKDDPRELVRLIRRATRVLDARNPKKET